MKKFKKITLAIALFVFIALMPGAIYAKANKTAAVSSKSVWFAYGQKYKLDVDVAKDYFKLNGKGVKVSFIYDKNGVAMVNKKGKVTVKKPSKSLKNFMHGKVAIVLKTKGRTYEYWYYITATYSYDEDNPPYGDYITKAEIARFKDAYKTGKTNKLTKMEKKIFPKVKKAVNYAKKGANRYEKVKLLNEWMCKNAQYDHGEKSKYCHSYIGLFLNGYVVCQGYMNAFQLCAEILGVPCQNVLGHMTDSVLAGHGWNVVKLDDGNWYHIDVTNNDSSQGKVDNNYMVFCSTDKDLKKYYTWCDSVKCKGKKNAMQVYEADKFVYTKDDLYKCLKEAVKAEEKELTVYGRFDALMSLDNYLLSQMVGRNVEVEEKSAGSARQMIRIYDKEECYYYITTYTIKYTEGFVPITYVQDMNELRTMIGDAITNNKEKIEGLVIDFDYSALKNDEYVYKCFGKRVKILINRQNTLPAEVAKDGVARSVMAITIYYGGVNDVVYTVTSQEELYAALDDVVANQRLVFYIYCPTNRDASVFTWAFNWQTERGNNFLSVYRMRHDGNGYTDPDTGEHVDSGWWSVSVL